MLRNYATTNDNPKTKKDNSNICILRNVLFIILIKGHSFTSAQRWK